MGRGPKAALELLLREPLFTGALKDLVITTEMVERNVSAGPVS